MILKIIKFVGTIAYWLSWPLLVLVVNGSQRTRIILKNGDYILVSKDWLNDGRWGLPGGGLRRNEPPLNGVLRELKEETGLVLDTKEVKSLGTQPFHFRGFNYLGHYFTADISTRLSVKPHHEVASAEWKLSSQMNTKTARPDVLTAMELVANR
jgi:ADP-ribose pyrophosphatase YjhB (NUDIX family)